MSGIFIFEIKSPKKNKNFNFFTGCFSVMCGAMVLFWRVFGGLCEASNKYKFS